MTKRFVSLSLVFTLLMTLFIPFSPKAVAVNDSLTILPAKSNKDGIQLQWRTTSSSQAEESFVLIKNAEEKQVASAEINESSTDSEGNLQRTYQFIDQQVIVDETYTYSIKRIGDTELQTQPIDVTFQQGNEAQDIFKLTIDHVSDRSIKVTWPQYQDADLYQIILDGKVIEDIEQQTTYEFKNLVSETSYSINIKAIKDGTVLTEAEENVKTSASQQPENVDQNIEEEIINDESKNIAAAEPTEEIVSIPDAALKRVIKSSLKLDRNDIYLSDMEKLTTLHASYEGVKNLTGLEKATNLQKLELAGNDIKDASVLQNLVHLNYLDLSETGIKNIEPISTLSKLETLDISYLELSTILPLEQLANLTTLTVYGELYFTLQDEIAALERDGLTIIHDDSYNLYIDVIKANETRAIINWEYAGENEVDYYNVKVADNIVKVDAQETSYTFENLDPNTSYDVEIIAYDNQGEQLGLAMSSFKTLQIPSGEKVDFPDKNLEKAIKAEFGLDRDLVVTDMESLEELFLYKKRITDLTGLELAENLRVLYLAGNKITNFSALNELDQLESLSLGETGIKDLSILANLQKLADLSLEGNDLDSLATLPNLPNLANLTIYDNNIKTLSGLENFKQLEVLDLDNNPIESIAGIEQLSNLKDLYLSGTMISDIDKLVELDMLQYVALHGTENLDLSNESVAQVIGQLENKGVMVAYDGSEEEEEWLDIYINAMTENSMELYWDYYGEQEISSFEIYVNGELLQTILASDENYLKIEELESETDYEVEVKALNEAGELVLSSTTAGTTWGEPTGDVVVFKDEALKELVKEDLGIDRDPRESDLEKLSILYLHETDITDLTGLEYATNLNDFSVYRNTAPLNLAPLENLTELTRITIDETPIESYSGLEKIKNLHSLTIMNNELTDISFVSSLTKLEDISLMNNHINNISALESLTKLNFINLANNQIEDLSPLAALNDYLAYLDVSNNPIKDLTSLENSEYLFELILDETMIEDITTLLTMTNLERVSLYNIPTLDLSKDSVKEVIEQLKDWGVEVNVEIDSTPELHIDEVTQNSISISWDKMLPKGKGEYVVNLYSNFGEELVETITLDSSKTNYTFTGLTPFTDYLFDVTAEEEDYYNYVYGEATTLPIEGSVKDVSMFVYKTEDVPVIDAMFDLYGIDEENEQVYRYGWSDEQGRLIDYTDDEPIDIFELPIGNYEIIFTTEDGNETSFQFEITGTEDYVENPIFFLLEEGEDPVTPPNDGDHGEDVDKEDEGKAPTPSEGKNPPTTVDTPTDGSEEKANRELPETASMMYNYLIIGLIVLSLGGAVLFIQKRKKVNEM